MPVIRPLTLPPRLQLLADLVPPGARVVDVGTDHAYLPVRLLQAGIISRAIASDLRPGPLSRAGETALRYGAADRIDLRLCDGLCGIAPEEADTVIIAGMGGETIAGILAAAPWTRTRRCILQPMTAQDELRAFLNENGYRIEEHICREGNLLYIALVTSHGTEQPFTPAERRAGRQTQGMVSPLRSAYLESLIAKTERALAGMRRASGQTDETALAALRDGLVEMKKEWDLWQR